MADLGNPVFACPECDWWDYEKFPSGVVICRYCGYFHGFCEHLMYEEDGCSVCGKKWEA